MNIIPEQENEFNYSFGFKTQTGNVDWSISFGSQIGHVSQYDNLFLTGSISGDYNTSYSLYQNNNYLAVGDPYQGIVDVYENFHFSINSDNNEFIKRNQLYGAGVNDISGFGRSIFLIDDALIVGAPFSNDNAGGSFLYRQYKTNKPGSTGDNEWNQTLFQSGSVPSGMFGYSHAGANLTSDYIFAISAIGENDNSGSVYLYKDNLSTLLSKLQPSESGVLSFGKSLYFATAENVKYLAVGYEQDGTGKIKMYKESSPGLNDFSAYRTLMSNNPSSGDLFGYSIEGDGDYFVVGSPNENNSGAAYYYKYNSDSGFFENKQRIIPNDLQAGDHFGKNVSFNHQDGIITSNHSSGKGYIYYHNNDEIWEQVASITGTNANSGSFGGDVSGSHNTSMYNSLLIVGSTNETGTYIYTTGAENFTKSEFFSISGKNGKLYDNDGNFIFGYKPNIEYQINGTVYSGNSSIFINDQLYNSNVSRSTGNINAWDMSGQNNLKHYYLKIYDVKD